jgi:PAS domain S-box-containing protein
MKSKAEKRPPPVALPKLYDALAALFQFAPDAMLLVDARGGIVRISAHAEAMFGYTPDELAGKKIEILMPVRFRQRHVKHRAHYAQKPHRREMGSGLELAARRKDGTEFPVQIMLSPMETPGGPCVIATVRDITERKLTEQLLKEAHAELEDRVRARTAELAEANETLRKDAAQHLALIEAQREIARPDQDVTTSMTMVARRTQELTQASGVAIDLFERDELVLRIATGAAAELGPAWLEMVSALTRECLRSDALLRCDDTENDPRLDRVAYRKLGVRSIVIVMLYQHGRAAGVLKLLSSQPRAFGKREVAVAQMMAGLVGSPLIRKFHEKSEKLASLAGLAAGVAHEIRNPLTAIKARLYTHQKRLVKGSPEAQDGEFIAEEIGRLERIVREFLQFARPGDPLLAPVSPAELLGEVRELLAPQLAKSSIHLTLADAVSTPVRADRQQIKQVLINLVRNAAESIGHDGRVTLRARQPRIGLGGHAREAVTLEVKDTGPGIPAELQKQLFDPFFTTKAGGTGLGLSIAARIVEKHGGALEFSTSNKGAIFRIVLPVAKTP